MKLRNKKTGEIQVLRFPHNEFDEDDKQYSLNLLDYKGNEYIYNSLAELNEDWEDYKPVEPLIKDEEIRKAIQAWADANDYDSTTNLKYDVNNIRLNTGTSQIEFDRCPPFDRLEDGATYSIAELCGEEEE